MANFFDRFDPPSTKGKPNYFDRFDEPRRENRKGHDNVPAFDPGVPGYNAETGMVERTGAADKIGAFSSGAIDGIPIAGPAMMSGAKALAAVAAAPFSDHDFGEIYDRMGRGVEKVQTDNPNTTLAGRVTGAVAGTLPMIQAAPAVFGAGPGGIVGRSVKSMLGGGAVGGTDAAVRSGGDGNDVRRGIVLGGVAGVAGPVVGSALGAGYRGVSEFLANRGVGDLTGKGVKFLREAMQADGLTAEEAGKRLAQLGPDAMLADIGPNTQQLAAGLVAVPGEGRGIVQNAIRGRDASANSRITGMLDETLGPAPIPSRVDASIREGQRALGPSYDAVLSNAKAVDLEPIALNLDSAIVNARGEAKTALRSVSDMLKIHGTNELDPHPGTLLQTRQAVDGLIDSTTDSNVRRVLTDARRQIDGELTSKVPGIKEVDAQYAELARQRGALERGQTIFEGGRSSPRPQELAQEVTEGGLPHGRQIGPSAVPIRLRQGARAELDRIVGTNANDRVALQRLVRGEGDWNAQKMATTFGKDKTDKILSVLDSERVFADTSQFVTRNSATAARQEAAEMLKGGRGSSGMREAYMYGGTPGVARSAAMTGIEKVAKALMDNGKGADLIGLAKTVVSPDRQRIIDLLAKMTVGPRAVPAAIGNMSRAALLGPAITFAGR